MSESSNRAATEQPSLLQHPQFRDALVATGLAVAAAVVFRAPEWFGVRIEAPDGLNLFYLRNFGVMVLPFLAAYFAWKRSLSLTAMLPAIVPFAVGLAVLNFYPFAPGGHSEILASLHILPALWLAVGYAWCAGQWKDPQRRMGFVRFTGEWVIQYVLIALGGGVFVLFTVFLFQAIGIDPEPFIVNWLLPCGVVGAVIIAAALVEARLGVVEAMAPVLTMLFTPLFTLALLAFLVAAVLTGNGLGAERELLIGFDLLLILVLGLVLFALTARHPERKPGFFDALQLVLLLCALAADALALQAITGRITDYGFSPNRAVGLGLNLVLVVNLAWAAVLQARFLAGRAGFAQVAGWQTNYIPVYAAWAWVVVILFPPLFGFV